MWPPWLLSWGLVSSRIPLTHHANLYQSFSGWNKCLHLDTTSRLFGCLSSSLVPRLLSAFQLACLYACMCSSTSVYFFSSAGLFSATGWDMCFLSLCNNSSPVPPSLPFFVCYCLTSLPLLSPFSLNFFSSLCFCRN